MRENRIIESKESMPLDRLTATLAISGPVFIGVRVRLWASYALARKGCNVPCTGKHNAPFLLRGCQSARRNTINSENKRPACANLAIALRSRGAGRLPKLAERIDLSLLDLH
jgi:hypothetical protein